VLATLLALGVAQFSNSSRIEPPNAVATTIEQLYNAHNYCQPQFAFVPHNLQRHFHIVVVVVAIHLFVVVVIP